MVRIILLFCIFIFPIFATAELLAKEFVCNAVSAEVLECTYVEKHISGPMIIKEWRKRSDENPYIREIKGARSGTILIDIARLIFVQNKKLWVVQLTNNTIDLLSVGAPTPKVIKGINDAGHEWEITINDATYPKIMPGIATEDEPKLDLRIVRAN